MALYGSSALRHFAIAAALLGSSASAFAPTQTSAPVSPSTTQLSAAAAATTTGFENEVDERTGKRTGKSFLPPDVLERAALGNKIEKHKLAKDGTSAFVDVYEYARKIREGEMTWEEVEAADLDTRLKWVGLVHRNKRTPGQFMMRLKVPNGIINADQLRFYADSVEKYGPDMGVIDITTRQNIQLRGVKIEDSTDIIDGLHARNQTTFQSALDNVRNMVGSPLAGIDDKEMVDTRELCNAVNDLISLDPVTGTRGNPMWGNLPRKFNIAISGSRDDYAHTHINDIGLQPCAHAETGQMGFNVVLGGYMSIKRVAESIHTDMWIPADRNSVVTLCEAILRIFRDEGERKNRQQGRLMWLVEKYGVEEYKKALVKEVESYDRGVTIENEQPPSAEPFERRELLGVHPQPQEGKVRVGILVPAGRLSPAECRDLASLAETYSDGELRLTVEQNVILPNVDADKVDDLLEEQVLTAKGSRFVVNAGFIEGNLVSCTGAQFCGLALIETKANAESIVKKLEKLVTVDRPVRIHWTGCPNSCGQVQVADIGIMGAPARVEDPVTGKKKAVPGCSLFVGGRVGEDAHLSLEPYKKGIPLAEESLIPELIEILKNEFGAVDKVAEEKKKVGKRTRVAQKIKSVFKRSGGDSGSGSSDGD